MNRAEKLGVSPAFFISKYNFDFDADAALSMFPLVAALGYGAVQGEIAAQRFFRGWIDGGIEAFGAAARAEHLQVRQFVLHYLLEETAAAPRPLDAVIADIREIGEPLGALPGCDVLTIPVGPHADSREQDLSELIQRLLPVLPPQLRIALEALPGSSIATPTAMAAFLAGFPPERVGINLDTGHLWSQGIPPERMAEAVGAHRVFGTHICDNDGSENASLAPGRGTIDWHRFFNVLADLGYEGPIDIEIRVSESEIEPEYAAARAYVEPLIHTSRL